jgi:MoaA/NifB/PqqE/SkfB family radical SAM enzyme
LKEIVIPKIIWLTVNRACNLRCCWCYAKGAEYSSADNATPEYARSVLGLAKSLSVKSVTIIGGEPTLWPHLLDTNQFCLEQDIRSTIVTNAIRFSDDSFWDRYIQSPNSSAGVSIKAHSANQLRLIAGSKQFESSIKGLKRAISHFRCGVDIVYNSFYSQNLVDIVKFAVDCGARSVSIGPCTPTFDGTWVDSRFMIEPTIMVKSITRDYEQLCSITNGHLSLFMKMPLCIWPRDFIERSKRNF